MGLNLRYKQLLQVSTVVHSKQFNILQFKHSPLIVAVAVGQALTHEVNSAFA